MANRLGSWIVTFLKTLVHFDQRQSVNRLRGVDVELVRHFRHFGIQSGVTKVMDGLSGRSINFARPRKANFIRTGSAAYFLRWTLHGRPRRRHSGLKHEFCKINGNGSSIHVGILSFEDPSSTPMKTSAPFDAEKRRSPSPQSCGRLTASG